MARDELLEVDWDTRATISTVAIKLRNIHKRCLDDPSYTVAFPLPRKPPWTTLKTQTQTSTFSIRMIRISAKMAQNHGSGEQNHSNSIEMPMNNSYYPVPNYYWPLDTSINPSSMQPEGAPFMYAQFTDSGSIQTIQESGPSNTLTTPHTTSIEQGIAKRARNHSEMTDHSDEEQEYRRKVRKKKKASTRHSRRNAAVTRKHIESHNAPSNPITIPEEEHQLFPCPFYHHDPMNMKYRTKTWQCCGGPGWTIPRLKLVTPP